MIKNLLSDYLIVVFLITTFTLLSCQENTDEGLREGEIVYQKINFSLSEFNANGLYGKADGLRAMDYKFCIPAIDSIKNEILRIDTTIKIFDGSGYKNNCSETEYFCIGNTHKPNFKEILLSLASLDYVMTIEPHYWEQ